MKKNNALPRAIRALMLAVTVTMLTHSISHGAITLEEGITSGASWPEPADVQTAPPGGSNTVITSSASMTSQTFTPTEAMELGAQYLSYSMTENSQANAFTIRIQAIPGGAAAANYASGPNLLGTTPVSFSLNSTGGQIRTLKLEFDGEHQLALSQGTTYAIEISTANTQVRFYRRTTDTYSGGALYANRTAFNYPNTRDIAMAVVGVHENPSSVALQEGLPSGAAWPEPAAIQTGAPGGTATVITAGSTTSQTFTPAATMNLGSLYLSYSMTENSPDTAFSLRIQTVPGGNGAQNYTQGTNLLGPTPITFGLDSTGGQIRTLKLEFSGDYQIPLTQGTTYAVELVSTGPTVRFYRRTTDTYAGGALYTNRTAFNYPNTRDLAMAVIPSVAAIPPVMTLKATASSFQAGTNLPCYAIDGDHSSFWHTQYQPSAPPLPQSITLDQGSARTVSGLMYLPRQDGNTNGNITGYKVYSSSDGVAFTQIASGTWSSDASQKSVSFTPVITRYVRLEATAGVASFANAAELALYPIAARRANDFLNSIGVCSSVNGRGENLTSTIACAQYLGLRWFRAGSGNPSPVPDLLQLHTQTGVRFSFGGGNFDSDLDLPTLISQATQLAQAGALLAFEGPNEPNTWTVTHNGQVGGGGASYLPVARLQRDLYSAVKADPLLASYPVWACTDTGAETDNVGLQFLTIPTGAGTLMPDGTRYADYANIHNYIYHPAWQGQLDNKTWRAASPLRGSLVNGLYGNFGKTWKQQFLGYSDEQLLALPKVTTETGCKVGELNVTEEIHGLNILTMYLAQYKRGTSHTSLYILRDRTDESGNQQFGFYRPDYTPRPAAHYLHNLTTILADTGSIESGTVNYSIANQPSTLHDLLLQKSNGSYFLVLWNERLTGSNSITVQLGAAYPNVRLYKPTEGTSVLQTFANVSSVNLTLDNKPVILQLN